MQHSKQSLEGYIMVDHRGGPGLDDAFLDQVSKAFPTESTLPLGAGRGLFEAPLLRCSHCQAQVILSPTRNLALRPRTFCPGCGRYICDKCGVLKKLGIKCKPIEQVIDEVLEAAGQGSNLSMI